MVEAEEQVDPEGPAVPVDIQRLRGDIVLAKQLELGLAPRLALPLALSFLSDTIITPQRKCRLTSPAALSPFRTESI